MDGTITPYEIMPMMAALFLRTDQIEELEVLLQQSVSGKINWADSFVRRMEMFGDIPVSQIDNFLKDLELYPNLHKFILDNKEHCAVVTGSFGPYIEQLTHKIGCPVFSSQGIIKNDRVEKLTYVMNKIDVVNEFKKNGYRVVFVGDGANDVGAMTVSNLSIAAGMTHPPALGCIEVADYVAHKEMDVIAILNMELANSKAAMIKNIITQTKKEKA